MKKIVIDTYGADLGADVVMEGVIKSLRSGLPFFPIVIGDAGHIRELFEREGISEDMYETMHATDYIEQTEAPTVIFNGRDTSSIAIAYDRLKADSECVAMISPGNTGALLVGSICRLGLLPNMKFPALASALPCAGEKLLCLVDCGANVNCSAADLANFAKMGDVFCKCFCDVENPRVGIMSVGREKGKGTPLVQEAYRCIEQLDLNFVGNLEGSDMVSGYADVVVTDGFSGNLLLKNTEASGKAALSLIEQLPIDARTMSMVRDAVLARFEFNARGAATFLGTKKTVVKMHGCATQETVVAAIDQVLRLEARNFSAHVAEAMSK